MLLQLSECGSDQVKVKPPICCRPRQWQLQDDADDDTDKDDVDYDFDLCECDTTKTGGVEVKP